MSTEEYAKLVASLQETMRQLQQAVAALRADLAKRDAEIEKRDAELAVLRRTVFGKRGEKMPPKRRWREF